MAKVIYVNSFELSHSREAVMLKLGFEAPDVSESIYVVLSPAGATVLKEQLEKELEAYIRRFGNIDLGEWIRPKNNNCNPEHSYVG